MFTLGQKVAIGAVCLLVVVAILAFYPWWLVALAVVGTLVFSALVRLRHRWYTTP